MILGSQTSQLLQSRERGKGEREKERLPKDLDTSTVVEQQCTFSQRIAHLTVGVYIDLNQLKCANNRLDTIYSKSIEFLTVFIQPILHSIFLRMGNALGWF